MMAIQLPRLKKCCCCLPLRVGSLLIGYISIVFSLLSVGAVSFSLYRVIVFVLTHENEPVPEHTPEEITRIAQSLYITHAYLLLVYLYYLIISILLIIGVHMNKPIYMKTYYNSGLFLLVLALATVVVSTVFLHFIATITLLKWCVTVLPSGGSYYRKPSLSVKFFTSNFNIYLAIEFNWLIVAVSTSFVHAILQISKGIIIICIIVIIFYCLLVVRSAYLEVEEQNKPRDFEMQNLYIPQRAPLLL